MTYVNTEEMRRAAATADAAADSMRRSANTVDEAVRTMSQMFEQGYGGPGLRLIELLEGFQIPEPVIATSSLVTDEQITLLAKQHGCLMGGYIAFARVILSAPQTADLASWKARALEAENTVLKWEARATALDHLNLDAILSALEDPEHQAEEEAEKTFLRNAVLAEAALAAEETDVAIQKFGGQVYDDGGQTRSNIVAAILALKSPLPQEVQA